tara:strand:- start:261 stop:626 length:366 start_codon:yes stop_codon:yes gene_type:complete
MATFTGKKSIAQTDFLLTDTDVRGTGVYIGKDVFGGAAVVHNIFVENSGAIAYLKIYNVGVPDVGTTSPDIILVAPASEEVVWTIVDGLAFTNFSYASVSNKGTGGVSAPAGTIKLHAVVR